MDHLSPLNYIIELCKITPAKVLVSSCTTLFFFLFGDDQTAITIALIMLVLDTITGTTYALMKKKFLSSEFWRVIPKFIAIISAFIVGNLFSIFQQEIGVIIEYGIAAAVIVAEGSSILENVVKINPDIRFKKIIDKIKNI